MKKTPKLRITAAMAPVRNFLNRMPERNLVLLLSLAVGILCGFAAVVLKLSIEHIHSALTSWFGSGDTHNWLYLVYPGVGMLLSLLFVKYIVRDNIGHGVTKVLWPAYSRLLLPGFSSRWRFCSSTFRCPQFSLC